MLNLSAYAVHDQRIDQVMADLVRFRPRVMFAYPGTAYHLALALVERGIDLPLRSVITSGELLHPFQRQAIERQFQCQVHDYYGGEGMDVAMQCGVGSTYHINAESVIVEVVDAAGQPLPAGQEGAIVLTNLNAYAMPFIRYAIGDVGALSTARCACGRGLPLLDHVTGRSSDQLTLPSGRGLIMWFFTDVFRQLPGVESFQMRQTAPDRIVVAVVPGPDFGHLPGGDGHRAAGGPHSLGPDVGAEAAVAFLRQRLEEQVRGEAALEIRLVDEIPLGPGGKHRFFIADGVA
jgi:phenylacetate-CoA ligase